MTIIRLCLIIIAFVLGNLCYGQSAPKTFNNPILPGYHPDPSICRVGEDYYLITSTFCWFPGIPVYHSKDLVNWELIGHGIHRPDQLNFNGLPDKLGVFAATIRYHEGLFYIINTCVGCNNNFIITASNPAGPWSDPIWLPDAPGIDPSLMWDDDGKCYLTGHNSMSPEDSEWHTQTVIWNQELDLTTNKLVGKRIEMTHGHANNASYTEGPHLYKRDGKYLLMVSEGGTGMFHALSVHHSDNINGPYVADYINPVLSHRHLGKDYPIHAIGHGDLVQTQEGEWWCVSLGKRRLEKQTVLARETFLTKVEFEGHTPVFNPGEGRVLEQQTRPNLPWSPFPEKLARDEFINETMDLEWCTIRTPKQAFYTVGNGVLNLSLQPAVLDSTQHSSILVKRITDYDYEAMVEMDFKSLKENEQAGLVVYRTNMNHFYLVKEKNELVLYQVFRKKKEEMARVPYKNRKVILKAESRGLDLQFSYGESENNVQNIGPILSNTVIADGNGNMFNGPGIGVYATSNGKSSKTKARFHWFEYKPIEQCSVASDK